MKQKFIRCLSLFCVCLAISFIFSGCTAKTYHFIGIVNQETNTIVLYENLDEETKKKVDAVIGERATIKLSANDKFVFEYFVVEGSLEIRYKQTGTYSLNEKEKIITFYFPKNDGSGQTELGQQYENNRIIYYTNGAYLVFE